MLKFYALLPFSLVSINISIKLYFYFSFSNFNTSTSYFISVSCKGCFQFWCTVDPEHQ